MLNTNVKSNPQIQATDLRIRTRDILEQVRWQGAIYTVTNFGQPVAVLIPLELFQQWRELAARVESTLKNGDALEEH